MLNNPELAKLKKQVADLGNDIIERDARLISAIENNTAKIEKLQWRFLVSNIAWIIILTVWLLLEWWLWRT